MASAEALELYDSYVYNLTGVNPCAAAWEAANHRKNVSAINQDGQQQHVWTLDYDFLRCTAAPYAFRRPDGSSPEQAPTKSAALSASGQGTSTYDVETRTGRYTVQSNVTASYLFPGKVVEVFWLPSAAVAEDSRFAVQGTAVEHSFYRLNKRGERRLRETGSPSTRGTWSDTYIREDGRGGVDWSSDSRFEVEGSYTFDEIRQSPELRSQHLFPNLPSHLLVCRVIPVDSTGRPCLEQTEGWFIRRVVVKPSYQVTGWYGHCNGMSAASLEVPLPPVDFPLNCGVKGPFVLLRLSERARTGRCLSKDQVSSAVYERVQTTANRFEIQAPHYFGLATVLWQGCDRDAFNSGDAFYAGAPATVWGTRNDDFAGVRNMKSLDDMQPHMLFPLLLHHLQDRHEGVVLDTARAAPVLNRAVGEVSYKYTYVEPEDGTGMGYYDLDLRIGYLPSGLLWQQAERDFYRHKASTVDWRQYEARLFLDENGRITNSAWVGDSRFDHPDFGWVPVHYEASSSGSQNEQVIDQHIVTMLGLE